MTKSLGIVVALVLLVGGLSVTAYKAGYNKAEVRYLEELANVQDVARQRESEWMDFHIEREKAATKRFEAFRKRTDAESIKWAAVDTPDGERTRMYAANCPIPAGACGPVDPM